MFRDVINQLSLSNVAYANIMKDEFLSWHRVCVTLAPDAGLATKIESEIEEKSNFLDLVADMLRSAEDDNIETLEDILSMKLSSEAVHKLVFIIISAAKQIHCLKQYSSNYAKFTIMVH